MASKAVLPVLLVLCSAFLAGCTEDDGGTGSASIYVQDAPTDEFAEIHVVFTEVRVHAAGSGDDDGGDDEADLDGDVDVDADLDDENATDDNETDDTATDDDGLSAGWHTIFTSSDGVHVDLLNATAENGTAAFLGEEELESGKYTQIRITVIEAFGIDHDGNRVNFTLASGTLKLNQPFTVEADQETRIVLDFDLSKALKETGNGVWRMTPVVGRTSVDVVEDEGSGEETTSEGEIVEVESTE